MRNLIRLGFTAFWQLCPLRVLNGQDLSQRADLITPVHFQRSHAEWIFCNGSIDLDNAQV